MRQPICVHCEGVWTGNPKQPQAQCLRAADQLITSVDTIGDRPSASASARPSDDYLHIDARGLFAVPAFIDAHLHMLMGGDSLTRLDLSRVTSRSEFERAIMDRAAELPQGTWLEAHGWDESTWGGAIPTSDWLRRAGDRPCICWRMDRHAALVNQTVLDRIDNAVDPPGGRFARDQQGRATGIAYEGAAWHLINPLIPAPTRLQKQQALVAAERHLLDLGVASVGSMEYGADAEEIIADAARCSRVRIALTLLDRALPLDFSTGQRLRAMTGPGIIPDPLSVVGYKSFVDGTLGSRTARMLESYSDDACNCGLFLEHALDGTLAQWMQSVLSAGFSPSVHAIGDAALRAALDAAEAVDAAPNERPGANHIRIEHCQTAHAEDIIRLRGRWVSMQPLHRSHDARIAAARLGEWRRERFFPFNSIAAAGARIAFGSDWPIVDCNPLAGMRAAITGLDSDGVPIPHAQLFDVEATLRAYTCDAADCLRIHTGRLAPGYPADIVFLDRDPLTADWRLDPPQLAGLLIGGEIVRDPRASMSRA